MRDLDLQIIAHRGAATVCPENTMSAFKRAIEMGADAIETDVQMTKDGHLILIHDEHIERTTNGKGLVKDYTLAEIKKLDAGSWFNNSFIGESIPTLDELFNLIDNTKLWLNIEIKAGFILYAGIEQLLVNKIKEYQMKDRVIISSFNHYSIALIRKLSPDLETAILYVAGLYEPWEYAKGVGARFLHPFKEAVYQEMVDGAHQRGMGVHPYTIDKEEEMTALINMGVDGIITNVPDKLKTLLKR